VRDSRLTREALASIERWAVQEGIECLYFLADAADRDTAPLAEEAGFRLVDVRVTLDRQLGVGDDGKGGGDGTEAGNGGGSGDGDGRARRGAEGVSTVAIREAVPADVPELRRIAAASHHDSRFYHDSHFDRRRCDELYSTWIESCRGDPDGVVLAAAPDAGSVRGYITASLAAAGQGRIGLFAVDSAARGQGIGGRLIAAAFDWLAGRGATRASVVTQGRNVRAQRIYQQFGMRTRSLELWYHRWW
jgi:dTDP-4-amino-4,6-dideoxy-D-galactose acyltransferase